MISAAADDPRDGVVNDRGQVFDLARAEDRDPATGRVQQLANTGYLTCRVFGIDGNTHKFGTGRRQCLDLPGGAGYGDPKNRDPELIKRDVTRGYITAEAAKRDYGYEG